jgi:dynein heavy chain, axonemal
MLSRMARKAAQPSSSFYCRYDRKELTFRHLDDIQFVAAMGPPGGGRNAITNRYARHFSVVSVTAFDVNNLTIIFASLVDWWFRKYSYGAAIAKLSKQLVAATLDVYLRCQAELLPTPAKSHYTFNLRDVSKVVQGMLEHDQAGSSALSVTSIIYFKLFIVQD